VKCPLPHQSLECIACEGHSPPEKDGALVAMPGQQEAIRRMCDLRAAGASLRTIAAAMQTAGHRLSHEAVRGILAYAA
jgi:hypothetical protein